MVSAAKKTNSPIWFMGEERSVCQIAAETSTKPNIDPQTPSGERMGSAATC